MERYIKRQKSRRIKKYFLVTFISILIFIIILLLYQNLNLPEIKTDLFIIEKVCYFIPPPKAFYFLLHIESTIFADLGFLLHSGKRILKRQYVH